jgi:hypothetical protein
MDKAVRAGRESGKCLGPISPRTNPGIYGAVVKTLESLVLFRSLCLSFSPPLVLPVRIQEANSPSSAPFNKHNYK